MIYFIIGIILGFIGRNRISKPPIVVDLGILCPSCRNNRLKIVAPVRYHCDKCKWLGPMIPLR